MRRSDRFGAAIQAFFMAVLLLPAGVAADAAEDQLIVFVQPGSSRVDESFRGSMLPEIRRMAQGMNVDVSVVDADRRAPEEVAITPLMVFQNHRGRSIYQGRYTNLDRIRNFIRTSRYVPQESAALVLEDILVWQNGRARIWAPVKIARVTGTPPSGYDHDAFTRAAREAMSAGFTRFGREASVALGRADRGFYMDLYPWRADDGTLFLSLALYSQFHCKTPVFELKKQPLTGPWEDRKRLFQEAAQILEAAVLRQIADERSGDGFDPVGQAVRTAAWEDVGFPLPEAPEKKSAAQAAGPLPQQWRLAAPGPEAPPVIQFHFKAPLDHYRGEVNGYEGAFQLRDDRRLDGAEGWVTADPRSVTMGDGSLDSVLMGTIFLDAAHHPEASFTVTEMKGDGAPISYGRMSLAEVKGTFTLKGRKLPIHMTMAVEPVLDVHQQPMLLMQGMFDIDLGRFDIEGADGPAPANRTLIFDLFLPFRASAKSDWSGAGDGSG